jgi:hypothetical protein
MITVAQVIQGEPICFRRWLHFELRAQWEKVWEAARNFQLDNSQDNIFWNLGKSGKFTVKSVYDGLTKDDSGLYHKKIWKSKIPAKIKIFLWLMTFDALLTRDNLRKRKWQGDPCCVFYDGEESISHLFFQCPIARIVWSVVAKCFRANNIPNNLAQCWNWCEIWLPFGKKFHAWGIGAICWAIWKCRNGTCFDKKVFKSPLQILCHASSLMIFWAGLYDEMDRDQLVEGANLMLKVAKEILARQTARHVNQLLLHDGQGEEADEGSAEDDA